MASTTNPTILFNTGSWTSQPNRNTIKQTIDLVAFLSFEPLENLRRIADASNNSLTLRPLLPSQIPAKDYELWASQLIVNASCTRWDLWYMLLVVFRSRFLASTENQYPENHSQIFLSALMITDKWCNDFSWEATHWAGLCGITVAEVNLYERQLLEQLNYEIRDQSIEGEWEHILDRIIDYYEAASNLITSIATPGQAQADSSTNKQTIQVLESHLSAKPGTKDQHLSIRQSSQAPDTQNRLFEDIADILRAPSPGKANPSEPPDEGLSVSNRLYKDITRILRAPDSGCEDDGGAPLVDATTPRVKSSYHNL